MSCVIGVDNDEAVSTVYVAGNNGNGIEGNAGFLWVANAAIGLSPSGLPVPNGGSGVVLTRDQNRIGGKVGVPPQVHIAANVLNGIEVERASTFTVSNINVGLNQAREPHGNGGYGVLVQSWKKYPFVSVVLWLPFPPPPQSSLHFRRRLFSFGARRSHVEIFFDTPVGCQHVFRFRGFSIQRLRPMLFAG